MDKPVLVLSQTSTSFNPAHLSAFLMGMFSTFSCSFTQQETPPPPSPNTRMGLVLFKAKFSGVSELEEGCCV